MNHPSPTAPEESLDAKLHSILRDTVPPKAYNKIYEPIKALIRTETVEAVRQDRLLNTIFWKDKVDKMFDNEISIYQEAEG